jgi:sulfopyruvate decarboxylase alpha subunit
MTWPTQIHQALTKAGVTLVGYVPDAGHKQLIELCQGDAAMKAIPLTTEEEGVGLSMGAWLGGAKCVVLLQSSGIGNLVNALGSVMECRFPLLLLTTMRGEEGEFNPWQTPMGAATPAVLEAMGVRVRRVDDPYRVSEAVTSALDETFGDETAVALLISQSLVGIKSFKEQANR